MDKLYIGNNSRHWNTKEICYLLLEKKEK